MRGDALVPYRASDDQAPDIERWVRQQPPEPLEPAQQVCLAGQPRAQRGAADEDELTVGTELAEYLVKVAALDRGQSAQVGSGSDPAGQADAADRCAHGCHGGHLR